MNSLIIRNARVRTQPQLVDIAIDGSRISAVGPSLAVDAAREIDAAGSLVLPGVSIGEGCVVGAGAVVVSDLEPYTVSVGNPARPIKSRR